MFTHLPVPIPFFSPMQCPLCLWRLVRDANFSYGGHISFSCIDVLLSRRNKWCVQFWEHFLEICFYVPVAFSSPLVRTLYSGMHENKMFMFIHTPQLVSSPQFYHLGPDLTLSLSKLIIILSTLLPKLYQLFAVEILAVYDQVLCRYLWTYGQRYVHLTQPLMCSIFLPFGGC